MVPSAHVEVHAQSEKPSQTITADFSAQTGDFLGGASGTLYGLGDNGSPTNAILEGARIENSSQKPPMGTQHPSGDALAIEQQFFTYGGKELAVYMQDYYPDWSYNHGSRPGDDRTYKLDIPVDDPEYGTYTEGSDGVWDYAQITEIVVNKILANTQYPDQYTFIPFNEPDGGNWYWSDDDASAPIFNTFLQDWDNEYYLIQKIWKQYVNQEKPSRVVPSADHAQIAGPGDTGFRLHRSDAFLQHTQQMDTLPDVFVWHELGKNSLAQFRQHYDAYRGLEKKYGISPRRINITEYGELRDMGVPGQLIQWMSMFEDKKVQAETAYWNYAGNLSDNMSRSNAANAGWWMFKWYGDLRGSKTVKVTSEHPDSIDNLQAIAAFDSNNRRLTVLYGGANDANNNPLDNTGENIPVTIHLQGLDTQLLGNKVDVEVQETAYVGPDGVAPRPQVVNVVSNADISSGNLDVTTMSTDRYAGYKLVLTPHQDRLLKTDAERGHAVLVNEAENLEIHGAQSYGKTPLTAGWGDFMFSGNHDVGSFGEGDTVTWSVNVPHDGSYRLQVISANTGSVGTNRVTVNDEDSGQLVYTAELANKDAAKWKYRGSAELILHNLHQGENAITIHGSSFDNTLDKVLLYEIGEQSSDIYPVSDMRFNGHAGLTFNHDGTDGFASIQHGQAQSFIHAWDTGYYDVAVTYNAPLGSAVSVARDGIELATIQANSNGLQKAHLKLALEQGINTVSLSSNDDVRIAEVAVHSMKDDANASIFVEAEDATLSAGASVVQGDQTNASGNKWVEGIGNQFVTEESGTNGYGDRTRVVVTDTNNTPAVITDNKGTLTLDKGVVPAGDYLVDVHYSNDAFIGKHDYNPQIVDLGLQIRSGTSNGAELARSAFRYTFSEQSFLHKAMQIHSDGEALVFGNWDPAGTSQGSVSWGVAPNIDYIALYPVVIGNIENDIEPKTLVEIKANSVSQTIAKGTMPTIEVVARYADGSERVLSQNVYQMSEFDSQHEGKQHVQIQYVEGRVECSTEIEITVQDQNSESSSGQQNESPGKDEENAWHNDISESSEVENSNGNTQSSQNDVLAQTGISLLSIYVVVSLIGFAVLLCLAVKRTK